MRLRLLFSLAATAAASLPAEAGITAVNGGTYEWNTAGWTAGVPTAADAAFINDIAKLIVAEGEPAVAEGIRIGNVVPQLSSLQIEGSSLAVQFIVVGDAADSNASIAQSGGTLVVDGNEPIDFELGNPFNAATKPSHTLATFAAGKALLGDIRFNLRAHRRSRLAIFGVLADVRGDSLRFETAEEKEWKPAELCFVLSDAGIAPLRLSGSVDFGAGDRVLLEVDGTRFSGPEKEFVLIDAAAISGEFKQVKLTGLPEGAKVAVEGKRLVLSLP